MPSILNSIPFYRPQRNTFPRFEENRLTTDNFRITPIGVQECYPDDVWKLRSEVFARMSPLRTPIMHRFDVRVRWFFVPTRILWDGFEDFMSSRPAGASPEDFPTSPKITLTGNGLLACAPKTLLQYMDCNSGLAPEDQADVATPAGLTNYLNKVGVLHPNGLTVSQLPLRAYQQIYNDWFLATAYSNPVDFKKDSVDIVYDGSTNADAEALLTLRNRAWSMDYFTSAMNNPQRGPEVNAFDGVEDTVTITAAEGNPRVGLQTQFALTSAGTRYNTLSQLIPANYVSFGFADEAAAQAWVDSHQAELRSQLDQVRGISGTNGTGMTDEFNMVVNDQTKTFLVFRNISSNTIAQGLSVQGTAGGTAVTIEELRIRFQMEEYMEREQAANGSLGQGRYKQTLYAHWGVTARDGRLQRAEFIGGTRQPMMINEVSQLSAPTDDDPLGQMAGQGVSSNGGRIMKYRCPEHGYLIGVLIVQPRTAYMQGLRKFWTKFDRMDYYFPEFAHVGEEPIYNRELLNNGLNGDEIFGYNIRNLDLKVGYDSCHGDMVGSLAHWHAARSFATPARAQDVPKLSPEFVQPTSSGADDIDRVFPVDATAFEILNADHYVFDVMNKMVASRLMPKYSRPRIG